MATVLLVVENNGIGISVLEKLINKEYPNLYYSVKGSHEYVEQHKAEYMPQIPFRDLRTHRRQGHLLWPKWKST